MKKQFKNYAIMWSIALVVFSLIVFLVPDGNEKYTKFGGSYWVGYILILLAFIGQLIVSKVFFKESNKDKVFLKMRMFSLGVTCLVLSLIFGTALMIIPDYPQWLGAIIVIILLGFYIAAVFWAKSAADAVEEIGERSSRNASFVKSLTLNAESLISKAKSDEAKEMVNKVFEAIKYSNKTSNESATDIENQIAESFTEFSRAISSGDDDTVKEIGNKLLELIDERDIIAKTK